MMQTKIYCTKCGREIKDGLLYCDRCGQSVKKSMEKQNPKSKKQQKIEELQQERINRRQRQEEKERKKQANRQKNKKRMRRLMFVVILLIIAFVSGSVAYIRMVKNTGIVRTEDVINEDIASTSQTPAAQQQTSGGSDGTDINTSFKVLKADELSCPYPAYFTAVSPSGAELMHLTDTVGGAVMIIAEDTPSGDAKDMMLSYADKVDGEVTYSRAGDDWYAVTSKNSTQTLHRKYVLKNDKALYYEFTYDTASLSAADYESCITNLDENFSSATGTQE